MFVEKQQAHERWQPESGMNFAGPETRLGDRGPEKSATARALIGGRPL